LRQDVTRRTRWLFPTFQALFNRQIDQQIAVFQALVRERELTRMPRVEPVPEEPSGEQDAHVRIRAACV
jgi:hypothetical protein